MKTRLRTTTAAVMVALAGSPALAVENIVLNGFMTAGATITDSDTEWFNGNITEDIGFEQDSRVGLQVSAQVNPKTTITAQLLGRARDEDYDAFFDWGFVGYTVNDQWELRAGKIKFPTYLISDYVEVGFAYPWIRPPQEVYTSNPLTAISGADALFRTTVGNSDLLIQPYIGTSRGQDTVVPQFAVEFSDGIAAGNYVAQGYTPDMALFPADSAGSVIFAEFEAENLVGINASMAWESFSVRAGFLSIEVSADGLGVTDNEDAQFWSVGGTMDYNDFVGYAEYFEREIDGAANLGFPNQKGYYATLGYRMGKWMPHLTYAKLDENGNPNDCGNAGQFPCGEALKQDSVTAGVRYELGAGAALKAEVQFVDPEGRGLFTGYKANGSSALDANGDADEAVIYSVAIDVVF